MDGGMPRLRRRLSSGSDSFERSVYDDILDKVKELGSDDDDESGFDAIAYLAQCSVDGFHVFDVVTGLATSYADAFGPENNGETGMRVRVLLLDLLRPSLTVVDYNPEIVGAALAVLSGGQSYWDLVDKELPAPACDPAAMFLRDGDLLDKLLNASNSRWPYEALPFLKLMRTLASCRNSQKPGVIDVTLILLELPSFTFTLQPGFRDYQTTDEEENGNIVQLTRPVRFFESRKQHGTALVPGDGNALVVVSDTDGIPAGTKGRVISETNPVVAIWFHKFNGLRYFGRLLETALSSSDTVDAILNSKIDGDSLSEIIGMLAALLTSSYQVGLKGDGGYSASDAALKILEEASDGVGRNRDVISIIFDVFEEELQRQYTQPDVSGSLDVLVNCIQFIHAVLLLLPGRVWPLLSRSSLLDIEGRGDKLSAIVAGTEMVVGRYEFLGSCIRVLDLLVEDVLSWAVVRKGGSKFVARFEGVGTGIPEKVMKNVLLAYVRITVDVFESAPNWRFAVLDEQLVLGTQITSIFNKILSSVYGVDDAENLTSKITGVLAPSAEYLLGIFLSPASSNLPIQPILQVFNDGIGTPSSTLFLKTLHLWTGRVVEVLRFCSLLVKIGTLLRKPTSNLEKQLFKTAPLLARLYVVQESYRAPVVSLLEALVISASSVNVDEEPPSLLGHLGPEAAKNFLCVLATLGKPLESDDLEVSIWRLLSAVVSNRQQWFSIYLLTGDSPRSAMKDAKSVKLEKPLLSVALDALSDIDNTPITKALAMLEFVAFAKDFWPWAMSDLHKHPKFLTAISDFVSKLKPQGPTTDITKQIEACNKTHMASFVAEILAMCIHNLRQIGDTSLAKQLIGKIQYFTDVAVAVPSYNASLQANLKRNFEAKFPGCSLMQFKRTQINKREFGRDYFYDVELAGSMLSFDQAWAGRKNDGLREELMIANVNLSVVESQVVSIHSGDAFLG
jgi:nuclear pore complex protein Nup188